MLILPVQLFLAATVGLGLYNLWCWWRDVPLRTGLIAAHFLCGVGATEGLAAMLQASGLRADAPGHDAVIRALALLAAAVFFGVIAALLRKSGWMKLALTLHVCAGLSGFGLVLALGLRL